MTLSMRYVIKHTESILSDFITKVDKISTERKINECEGFKDMPALIILSEEEEKKVTEMYANGMSLTKLYKNYGYGYTVVRRALANQGVEEREERHPRLVLPQEEVKEILKLHEAGWGIHKIGRLLGRGQETVRRVIEESRSDWHRKKKPIEPPKPKPRKHIEEGDVIDCDIDGRRCIYRNRSSVDYKCDYCSRTGSLRGGSPHECSKWKVMQRGAEKRG